MWKTGKVTDVSALRDPWLRQKTDEGETIIGAKSILNQGTTLADATSIQFDEQKNIKDRYDARTATLQDGYWELTDVMRFARGQEPQKLETFRISTQLRPGICGGKACLARDNSLHAIVPQDRSSAFFRLFGKRI